MKKALISAVDFSFIPKVKDLHLHPEQFTVENGLLTPTLKAKRAEVSKLFKSQIDSLYANMQWCI